MNDSRDSHRDEKLLAEIFHDDWAGGPAADFARAAAASARRRRAIRRTLAAATGVAVATAALVFGFTHHPAPSALPATTHAGPAYETLSDEEFLAQIKDRPLLVLPQENGTKKIVLLDR